MAKIDEQTTKNVAKLSAIELSDSEVAELTPQLQQIVEYFDSLAKVEVKDVEPLLRPFEESHPLRSDESQEVPLNENKDSRILDSAPEVEDHGFKVPPIL